MQPGLQPLVVPFAEYCLLQGQRVGVQQSIEPSRMAVAVQVKCQSVLEGFFSRLFVVDLEVFAYGVVCRLVCVLDDVREMYGVE